MERLLSQAAAELAIRSEVEATLNAVLQDVEHAHALEESLRAHNELHQCREQLQALKVRYDDREAAWEEDRREKERLGMLLLEEIVKLSAREVEGEKSKREMEMKLRQLEEEKRMTGGNFAVQQPLQNISQSAMASDENDKGGVDQHGASQTAAANENLEKSASQPLHDKTGGDQQLNEVATSDTTKNEADSKNETPIEGGASPTDSTKIETAAEKNNLTNEVAEDMGQGFSAPQNLHENTLMEIFAYLDPLDVMNFAQSNKALLSKVNVMFGMSSGEESDVDQGEQQQQQSASGEDSAATSVKEPAEPKPSQAIPKESVPATPTKAVTSTASAVEATHTTSTTAGAKSSPKLFGLSGPSHKRQGSGTSVATTGSAGTANPFSQVSSWFGANTSAGTADTSSTASVTTVAASASSASTAAAPVDTGSSEIKLNAAMANSMAQKLTPAELSIILRMREKLQKCEADANKWRLEKEDAMANLASVEAVKEFLVARVRDTERVVQKQKEEMSAVQKKALEDQEVIVFLDEKVKELEKSIEDMKSKEATTKKESIDIVNKNEKKARVLSDMLRFEREQMAANEKEWKTAKKVLVKEVKSCRARIVALEAEAEGCRQQNAQLKQGLMALQSSGSMSPKGKKSLKGLSRF